MGIGTVFVDQGCQAIRLPADMRLPAGVRKVSIRSNDQDLIVASLDHNWGSFFQDGSLVSEDFLTECSGQRQQAREAL